MAEEKFNKGKALLEEVARGYAADHGLRPEVEWEDQGYQWLLRVVS